EGIEASDFNNDGSVRNSIYSDSAVYDPGRKMLEFDGDVHVFLGEGVELRAEALYYDLDLEIGDIPGKTEFISNNVSGSARDVRFFRNEDRLELGGDADFSLIRENAAAGKGAEGAIRAAAARGMCLLAENRVLFSGGVRIESPDMGTISADAAEIDLNSDRSKITRMAASGETAYEMRSRSETRFISGGRMVFTAGITEALEKVLITEQANLLVKSADEERTLHAREIEMFMDSTTGAISEITGTTGVDFRYRRGAEETRAGGDAIYAAFADAGGRLRNVSLSGRSRFAMAGTEKAANELRAETIKAGFRAGSGDIEGITANGGVRWVFEPSDGAVARTLLASNMEIRYAGDHPEWGEASGAAAFEESSAAERMTRRLNAEWMRIDFFPADGRIKSLTARDGVHTVYERAASSSGNSDIERVQTSSDSLEAFFDVRNGDSALLRAAQRGNFRFISGERSASADEGEYAANGKKLILTGSPEILDVSGRLNGDRIEYDLDAGELLASGRVRAVLDARQTGGALFQTGGNASPVVVTAKELRYWTAGERFKFSGDVMALTESQQLGAREIAIGGDGNMTAAGGVIHRIEETNAAATIKSGQMEYRRGEGVIRYSNKVEMNSDELVFSADTLSVTLDDEEKAPRRVLAGGNVFLRHDGRVFSGDTAEWIPASSAYVFTGTPAIIDDPARGRSMGGRLTYFQEEDRIVLEPQRKR
ncbi:MAG: hypothetical protein LBJ21_10230, partial [Acidobacteriota bacterium]|nr:hypothetical protein [Acidobacteriota bacterium]